MMGDLENLQEQLLLLSEMLGIKSVWGLDSGTFAYTRVVLGMGPKSTHDIHLYVIYAAYTWTNVILYIKFCSACLRSDVEFSTCGFLLILRVHILENFKL